MSAKVSGDAVKWPYPVNYGKEHRVKTDVLVLGGGVSGIWAAISAAKKGVTVAAVEKGCFVRAGCGGRGVDHWQLACKNPASKVTPEEIVEAMSEDTGGYHAGHARYIQCQESYETLLELEGMGGRIRDMDDEFKGAPFRDDKSKLMFAYDYENKYTIRVWGAGFKPLLAGELKRLGVDGYERTMITSLLTEDGKPGGRVVGATGLNIRTGEFFVFEAKAVILCTASTSRLYWLNTEMKGMASIFHDPNCTGQGYDAMWRAGVEFLDSEACFGNWHGPISWVPYGTGNATNTWHGATIVDSNGKEVPWVDRDGTILKTVEQRSMPAPGQKFFLSGGGVTPAEGFLGCAIPAWYKYKSPSLTPKLPEMIRKGEIVPPLYADLTSMPAHERRVLFGLMVANEGKTAVPVYKTYTRGGFDPDKDMLQVPNFPNPEAYMDQCYWAGSPDPYIRSIEYGGGPVTDWTLRTSLEGLYAAGEQLPGPIDHSGSASTGRYAGRTASEYTKKVGHGKINEKQVEAEKARVYAPVKNQFDINHRSYDWEDINQGIAEIMRDFCPEWKNEAMLKEGLHAMKELRESELTQAGARNPHELMRVLECSSIMTCGEVTMQASLARKASNPWLDFKRLDYQQVDPPDWNKFLTIRLADGGEIVNGELPKDYWLKGSNAASYLENYKANRAK